MTAIELTGLEGTNPIALLAALGALDALTRAARPARLSWTDDLVPTARLSGATDIDDLVRVLSDDRGHAVHDVVLGEDLNDLKPSPADLAAWAARVGARGDLEAARRFSTVLAEGALAGNGESKPTHLHFTAGQQRFLLMVRQLRLAVVPDDLRAAIVGPWSYRSGTPSLAWDNRGERIYALRAGNPAKESRPSAPGVEWLAWTGLGLVPVAHHGTSSLRTVGCDSGWKTSAWRWPLWGDPLCLPVVRALMADPSVVGEAVHRDGRWRRRLEGRGVTAVLEAPIRRTDQGGYGSFGPAAFLADLSG